MSLQTSHMPSATLTDLPPELAVKVFEAADSFTTALILSRTCQRMHSIWKVNAKTILPAVVECYPEALMLAHAQEDLHTERQMFPSPGQRIRNAEHMSTTQRLSINADLTSVIMQHFEIRVLYSSLQRDIPRDPLTPTERADFLRASYRALTLAAWPRRGMPLSLLGPLDILEYMQMGEAMDVLHSWFNTGPKDSKNLGPIKTRIRHVGLKNARLDWMLFHSNLSLLPMFLNDFHRWGAMPFDYFTVADGYQAKVGSSRGPRMSELLPLLVARSTVTTSF